MLELLSKSFNYIIIDSPPLSSVSDARIMAVSADGVVFVVRALSTSRHVVIRSLEQLEKANSRILGVVLNDFDVQDKGSYYYPYYKQYHYRTAYVESAKDEDKQA
jgi:Mrp family chromosome partitioning ATPase